MEEHRLHLSMEGSDESHKQCKQCAICKGWHPLEDYDGGRGFEEPGCHDCRVLLEKLRNPYSYVPEIKLRACKGYNAKSRGLEFLLADQEALAMFGSSCFYCNWTPIKGERLNGIDRLDSNKGYVPSNCVPCCSACNLAKGPLDPETFVQRCKHIYSVHHGGETLHPGAWGNSRARPFPCYVDDARRRGLAFDLTERQFGCFREQPCFYCRKPNTDTHQNGLDRLHNLCGYTMGNCVPCCGECNYMKKRMTPQAFLTMVGSVARHTHDIPPGIPRRIKYFKSRCSAKQVHK